MMHRTFAAFAPRILITGALGQIGSELVPGFRKLYGAENVIATDIAKAGGTSLDGKGPYKFCNVLDGDSIEQLIIDHNIDWLVHLSAIMSVKGEANPHLALDLNINGTRNVLELAARHNLRCFIPSTMAVFNKDAGQIMTQDDAKTNPTTVYGITKVFLEQLGQWYKVNRRVDFRCIRYPGIIAAGALPGGGTTDYAVHMYHHALKGETYKCPVLPNEALPMMYMTDCVRGTIDYITAPPERLTRTVYNMSAMSFSPDDVTTAIRKIIPSFKIEYEAGVAQKIAETWPKSMDDRNAQRDWGWKPTVNLEAMTRVMLEEIPKLHNL